MTEGQNNDDNRGHPKIDKLTEVFPALKIKVGINNYSGSTEINGI